MYINLINPDNIEVQPRVVHLVNFVKFSGCLSCDTNSMYLLKLFLGFKWVRIYFKDSNCYIGPMGHTHTPVKRRETAFQQTIFQKSLCIFDGVIVTWSCLSCLGRWRRISDSCCVWQNLGLKSKSVQINKNASSKKPIYLIWVFVMDPCTCNNSIIIIYPYWHCKLPF